MYSCESCMKKAGWLLLIAGILFLLQDLKIWPFWGLNWYTVAFLLMGFAKLGTCSCSACKKAKK